MGSFAPSNRDNELRVEKLFLRKGLTEDLGSGKLLGLESFVSFLWHSHPNQVSVLTVEFLADLISARREGRHYTEEDWVKFTADMASKSSRDIVLYKLLHLGLIEKRNRTKMQYEIVLSDKFLEYLEYLAQSWVNICENGKVKR